MNWPHSRPAPLAEEAWAVLAGDGDAHPRRRPPRSAAPLAQGPPVPHAPAACLPAAGRTASPSVAAFGAGRAAQQAARGAAAGERKTTTAWVKTAPHGKATLVSGLSHDWDMEEPVVRCSENTKERKRHLARSSSSPLPRYRFKSEAAQRTLPLSRCAVPSVTIGSQK